MAILIPIKLWLDVSLHLERHFWGLYDKSKFSKKKIVFVFQGECSGGSFGGGDHPRPEVVVLPLPDLGPRRQRNGHPGRDRHHPVENDGTKLLK